MLAILSIFSLVPLCFASNQAVSVKGQLMCGKEPLEGAEVKLWELDWCEYSLLLPLPSIRIESSSSPGPNPDDELDTMFTGKNGTFQVSVSVPPSLVSQTK